MAIMINNSGQKKFFTAAMPTGWAATHVDPLIDKGVKFVIEFTAVGAEYEGKTLKVQLPCTTTQMMNKEGPLVQSAQQKVAQFVGEIANGVAGGKPISDYEQVINNQQQVTTAADLLHIIESVTQAVPPQVKATPTTVPKPVAKTVHLREAKAVGQKVFGTSSGSVYTAIAIGPRVNLAARLSDGSLSIRAEFNNPKTSDLASLQALGMTKGSDTHYSSHMKVGGVPVGRIIGALLMDCGELEFTQKLTNIKQFK